MVQLLQTTLRDVIAEHYSVDVMPDFTRPDVQFGDLASNVAMQVAGLVGRNPRQVADTLATTLQAMDGVDDVSIAGPGFINLRLTDQALYAMWSAEAPQPYAGQTVVAEYSDPNPFKVLHAGHLYTTLVGDSISRLLSAGGADVHRVNFGGDVGPHVARNMWAIIKELGGEHPEKLEAIGGDLHQKAAWLSERYVEGNTAYDSDEQAKREILDYNKRIYEIHETDDHLSDFAKLYWIGRQWSYDYFELLYKELGVVPFERYYPESMTTPTGVETVMKGLQDGVYERSDGAIVFRGEPYGLHTRVFINQQGLPTYEAKDVGLIMQKWRDYQFDKSIIITGNDIVDYMKVVQKSIEQFEPELVKRSVHLVHGNLKLTGGQKMSSRKGTVLLALDVLQAARTANTEQNGQANEVVSLGAVKYAFLKQRIGGDIIYQPEESVSLSGNSGPYLQYAHARACSIITKSSSVTDPTRRLEKGEMLDQDERALVRKLSEYPEVLSVAVADLAPHYLCNYLFELAQQFSRFYENSKVIGDERESLRLTLVGRYRDTLSHGLGLLGITAPEKL